MLGMLECVDIRHMIKSYEPTLCTVTSTRVQVAAVQLLSLTFDSVRLVVCLVKSVLVAQITYFNYFAPKPVNTTCSHCC